jgi:hypothetical protein
MRSLMLVGTTALSIACSGAPAAQPTTVPDPADSVPGLEEFTVTHPCGLGFYLGSDDDTRGLRLEFVAGYDDDRAFPPTGVIELPSPDWTGELVLGRDLYSNWCDDVMEPGEPEPEIVRSLPITGGQITWVDAPAAPFDGGSARIDARQLEITTASGDVIELGDVEITNPSFGFFAG